MSSLWSFIYLACCVLAAPHLYKLLAGGASVHSSAKLGQVLCGFAVFFCGFFVLGTIEVLGGRAWLDVEHALPIVLAGTGLLHWAARYRALAPLPGFAHEAYSALGNYLSNKLVLGVAASFVLLLALAFAQFPLGFEDLAYHLPTAAHFLQTHSIEAWDRHYPHTFPANASLTFAFFLRFLPERWISGVNFVFVIVTAFSLHRLSRQIGADDRAAVFAALGFLSLPMVLPTAQYCADLGGLAFLALAAVFALEADVPRRWLLCGLAMGLAFGFKSLHILPLGFFAVCALVSGWLSSRCTGRFTGGLRSVCQFSAGAIVTGGIWLLRNGVKFGNPLYPVYLPFFGTLFGWSADPDVNFTDRHMTQFDWVSNQAQWALYPWFEWQKIGQSFKFNTGWGAFFAAVVPASVVAAIATSLRYGLRRNWRLLLLMGCAFFIVTSWWVLDDRQPRYLLGAVVLLLPLSGWLLSSQPQAWRRRFEYLLGICVVVMLAISLSKELLMFGDRIILSRQTTRSAFYEYPPLVDNLPQGSTILNLGSRTSHYALFGARLQNRVISMPHARSMLGLPPSLSGITSVLLRAEPMQREGIGYLFSEGTDIRSDGCVMLQEIYRQTVNPLNQVPLPRPRTLYQVHYCHNVQKN